MGLLPHNPTSPFPTAPLFRRSPTGVAPSSAAHRPASLPSPPASLNPPKPHPTPAAPGGKTLALPPATMSPDFVEWREEFISQERGNRVVHYYLDDASGESHLAVFGIRHVLGGAGGVLSRPWGEPAGGFPASSGGQRGRSLAG